MKRVGGLCRVSTDRQKDEQTIEVQKNIVNDWAAANGATITEWYCDDGWSGELLARPELDRMRDDASKDLWDAVVCVDRDRIARKLSLQELIIDELQEKQKEVIIISDPLAETMEGRIMQQIKVVFAEYEKHKIAERMRRGKINKAKNGKLVGHNPAYGYRYVPRVGDTNGYFVIYEPEAAIVRIIYHWVADDGYSIRRVIKELYLKGIPSPKGKPRWVKSAVERVLKRTDYYGISYYNKSVAVVPKNPKTVGGYKKIKKSSRKEKPHEEWFAIEIPAIIEKSLYDKAQEALKANVIYNVRNKKYDYLLSGKVECLCGIKRVGDSTAGHYYYRCAQRIYKYPLPNKCPYEGVNAEILDVMVWNRLVKLLSEPEVIKAQLEKWKKKQSKVLTKSMEEQQRLQAALDRLNEEEERYVKAYGAELMSFEKFKENAAEIKAKKETLEQQYAAHGQTAVKDELQLGDFNQICDTITSVLKASPVADRQVYVRKLITHVFVGERRRALVKGRIPVHVAPENIQDVLKDRYRRPTQCRQIYPIQRLGSPSAGRGR